MNGITVLSVFFRPIINWAAGIGGARARPAWARARAWLLPCLVELWKLEYFLVLLFEEEELVGENELWLLRFFSF
jgi:hypothetical protein